MFQKALFTETLEHQSIIQNNIYNCFHFVTDNNKSKQKLSNIKQR